MDEVLRSRNLMAEILARAESIKQHMAQVNQSINNMKIMEDAAKAAQAEQETGLRLMDLPDGCLIALTAQLRDVRSTLALAQTCKRVRQLIEEDSNSWEERCRTEWCITEENPSDVPRLVQVLEASEGQGGDDDDDSRERSSRASTGSMRIIQGVRASTSVLRKSTSISLPRSSSSKGPTSPTTPSKPALPPVPPSPMATNAALWRAIYRDRYQGWALSMDMLTWLRDHGAPSSVTGHLHRMQLNLTLKYLTLCTGHQRDAQRRKDILAMGIRVVVALTENESVGTAEMAMQLLANLVWQDQDTKVSVLMLTQMGKSLSDKLDGEKALPGMVQQASRALVSLWAEAPTVPEIPLASTTTPATAAPHSGEAGAAWHVALQEYSLRGESMRQLRFPLTFAGEALQGKLHFSGTGQDPEAGGSDFTLAGELDTATGQWAFTRRPTRGQQTTITYKGYSDKCGAWGTYSSPMGRQLRVFRVFKVAAPAVQEDE